MAQNPTKYWNLILWLIFNIINYEIMLSYNNEQCNFFLYVFFFIFLSISESCPDQNIPLGGKQVTYLLHQHSTAWSSAQITTLHLGRWSRSNTLIQSECTDTTLLLSRESGSDILILILWAKLCAQILWF